MKGDANAGGRVDANLGAGVDVDAIMTVRARTPAFEGDEASSSSSSSSPLSEPNPSKAGGEDDGIKSALSYRLMRGWSGVVKGSSSLGRLFGRCAGDGKSSSSPLPSSPSCSCSSPCASAATHAPPTSRPPPSPTAGSPPSSSPPPSAAAIRRSAKGSAPSSALVAVSESTITSRPRTPSRITGKG